MDDNTAKVLLAAIGLIGAWIAYKQRQQGKMLEKNTMLTQQTATTQAQHLPAMSASLDAIKKEVVGDVKPPSPPQVF